MFSLNFWAAGSKEVFDIHTNFRSEFQYFGEILESSPWYIPNKTGYRLWALLAKTYCYCFSSFLYKAINWGNPHFHCKMVSNDQSSLYQILHLLSMVFPDFTQASVFILSYLLLTLSLNIADCIIYCFCNIINVACCQATHVNSATGQ